MENLTLVEQTHKIIEGSGLELIEKAGRTCYQSNDKIGCKCETEFKAICQKKCGSCEFHSSYRFTKSMVNAHHDAMLEHLTFAFIVESSDYIALSLTMLPQDLRYINVTKRIPDDKVVISGNTRAWRDLLYKSHSPLIVNICKHIKKKHHILFNKISNGLVEHMNNYHGPLCAIEELSVDDMTDYEKIYHQYITVNMTTNLSTCICVVRHRPNSFGMESTRYITYDNFKIILPINATPRLKKIFEAVDETERLQLFSDSLPPEINDDSDLTEDEIEAMYIDYYDGLQEIAKADPEYQFYESCVYDKLYYDSLMKNGWTVEEAREILPKAMKAELVVTTNIYEWWVMMNIREAGITGKPHAHIKELYTGIHADFAEKFPAHFGDYYTDILRRFKNEDNYGYPTELMGMLSRGKEYIDHNPRT